MIKSEIRIDILGTDITISADKDLEYLEKILEKYRRNIEKIRLASGLNDPLKIAVLTGFLLCDDLENAGSAEEKPRQDSSEAEELTLSMISRLQELIPNEEKGNALSIYKLENKIKNYDWGSPEWIPELLGRKNYSKIPFAELWMGVNPLGPSTVKIINDDGREEELLLSELISKDPEAFLGKELAEKNGTLPFLFKIEAAARPLSIQVHPNSEQAREGFERENQEGIPADALNRNFRDKNRKDELLCALTPFAALCGFRNPIESKTLISRLFIASQGALKAGMESLYTSLDREEPYKHFLAALFNLSTEAKESLGPYIKAQSPITGKDFPDNKDVWTLCAFLAEIYPSDAGILAPLYMNLIELKPTEAIYLPAGTPHCYIHGMGLELMTDSENVIRGGLTHKHISKEDFFRIINFQEYSPEILSPPEPNPGFFTYPVKTEEYSLSILNGKENDTIYNGEYSSILFISSGALIIREEAKTPEMQINRGESIFIPKGKRLILKGTYTAYSASSKV